jgi:glycosyltransferase involved in cell wall biosynthesis
MSKRILFICLHRPDRSPSQRFRFEQYLDFLGENGFQCKHVFLLNAQRDKVFYSQGKVFQKGLILLHSLVILIREAFFKRYDIVFVQREAFMLGTSFFERRFSKRSKLVFDFDDAIWRTQVGFNKSGNQSLYFLKNPSKTADIIKASHLVIAGNRFLEEYALQFNSNVEIIPTTIDTDEYAYVEQEEKPSVCIGWSGSFSTIIYVEQMLHIYKAIKDKYGDRVYFKVIGDGTFKSSDPDIQGIPWRKETELEDLSEIDIGLMPLSDDEWTKGKCALKGLQYMALGIPTIMSPVGVNNDVVRHGENGMLASTDEEWIDAISTLVEDARLRNRMGRKGRQTVVEDYSVHANKGKYLEYLTNLIDDRGVN